jgi:ABC-type lipoprotein release transport system permease subunit
MNESVESDAFVIPSSSGRLQPMLFEQSARDPGVYAVATGVLVLVAGLATLIRALRASVANPTEVLRGE